MLRYSPLAQVGIDAQVYFSVAGYGGLLLFRGITGYLHGLVSVYERPIIAGGRVWMAYSTVVCTYSSLHYVNMQFYGFIL